MTNSHQTHDTQELLRDLAEAAASANAVVMPSFTERATTPEQPRFTDGRDALTWCKHHHTFLVQSVDHARGLGQHRPVCGSPRAVMPWAIIQHLVYVMVTVSRTALEAGTEVEGAAASAEATAWLCRRLVGSDLVDEADGFALESVRRGGKCAAYFVHGQGRLRLGDRWAAAECFDHARRLFARDGARWHAQRAADALRDLTGFLGEQPRIPI